MEIRNCCRVFSLGQGTKIIAVLLVVLCAAFLALCFTDRLAAKPDNTEKSNITKSNNKRSNPKNNSAHQVNNGLILCVSTLVTLIGLSSMFLLLGACLKDDLLVLQWLTVWAVGSPLLLVMYVLAGLRYFLTDLLVLGAILLACSPLLLAIQSYMFLVVLFFYLSLFETVPPICPA